MVIIIGFKLKRFPIDSDNFWCGNRNRLSSHLATTEGSIISKSYALRKTL